MRELNLGVYLFLGVSFGTAVANEINVLNPSLFKAGVLAAPGEFIPGSVHRLVHAMFEPAMNSSALRKFYASILRKLGYISELDDAHLKEINDQWLAIVDYRVNYEYPVDLPVLIVGMSRDSIVQGGSQDKIMQMYPNHMKKVIEGSHLDLTRDYEVFAQEIWTSFEELFNSSISW